MFATYSNSNNNNNNNSSWIMNESLAAFYLSTNTFSNPIFDANQSGLTPLHGSSSSSSNGFIQTSKTHNDPLKEDLIRSMEAKKEKQKKMKKKRIKPSKIEMMEDTFVASKRKCSNFCDNIAFSVKSKMFVIELNFKRRLQRLRRFAGKRLPWMLFCLSGSSQRNSNIEETRMRYYYSSSSSASMAPKNKHEQQQQFWPSSTPIIISKKDEKFWSEIWPANSSESLVVQKEKILYRLERVLEAKRSANQVGAQLFNMGGHNCGCAIPTEFVGCKPAASLSAARRARRCFKEQSGGGRFLLRPQSSSEANNSSSSSNNNNNYKLKGKPKTTTLLGTQNDAESRSKSNSPTPIASSSSAASPLLLSVSSSSSPTSTSTSTSATKSIAGGTTTSYKVQNGLSTTTTTRKSKLRPSCKGTSGSGGGSRWRSRCKGLNYGGRRVHASCKQHKDIVTGDFDDDVDTGSEAYDAKKLCIVCYTNPPNIVTLPCKHHDICSDCFFEIIYMTVKQSRYPLKCVLCRQKIEKIRCSKSLLLSVIEKNRAHP